MKILADSGSTKTSWAFIENDKVISTKNTSGFNPYYYDDEILLEIIDNELLPKLKDYFIAEIYFYGAGCSTKENCLRVKNALSSRFKNATILINHDLAGAATALLKNQKGIACILGTGSNSCLWDGKSVISNVPSLGYMLGDEGSGTYIGMKILKGILENKAPKEIHDKFLKESGLTFEKILNKIYDEHQPNRFFANISMFAGKNITNTWIRKQVLDSFDDFITNQISHYPNYKSSDICFTGSVAYYFKDILYESLTIKGIGMGIILKEPMEGLIEFHTP